MAIGEAPVPDRRQRRRTETIEEVLDIAVDVMAEQGVAGLTVGEIARRMGIQPPSLYVYFPSKHALYDALFARGATELLDAMNALWTALPTQPTSLAEVLMSMAEAFVAWSMRHAAYAQLLFWRPVPGFTPSAAAYRPAIALVGLSEQLFAELQGQGLVRGDVPVQQVQRDWTILISGVVSQQLSNAPEEGFERGRFVSALPELIAMFARHYGSPSGRSAESGKQRNRDRTKGA